MDKPKTVEEPTTRILWGIYNLGIRNGRNGRKENEWARKEIAQAEAQITQIFLEMLPVQEKDTIETCCTCNCYKAGFNTAIVEIKAKLNQKE